MSGYKLAPMAAGFIAAVSSIISAPNAAEVQPVPASLEPHLILSEFMASNQNGIEDEDGDRSDWIEIQNLGPSEVDLVGWFLTDDKDDLTKWEFPSFMLPDDQFMLVWASGKDRRDPVKPLHTNFRLPRSPGTFLALVDPQTNIVSAFAPAYPPQVSDRSYGRDPADPERIGFFQNPTPGSLNSISGEGFAPEPVIAPASGVYAQNSITVTVTAPPGTIVRYTMNDRSPPTSASTAYTTPIVVNNSAMFKFRAFPDDPNLFPGPVITRSFVMLDSSAASFTSELPILIMDTYGRTPPQNVLSIGARTNGTFVSIDTYRGLAKIQDTPDFIGMADYEIIGQTSAGFQKQPHNVEIQDALRQDLPVPILGMPPDADWKLRNPWSDKNLINDFLAFELFAQMRGAFALEHRLVEVFRDTGGGKLTYPGDYYGVMLLSEKIEVGANRVDLAELTATTGGEPEISGGYMWKKDRDSAGDIIFTTSGGAGHGGQGMRIQEPKPREVSAAQLNWIRNYCNAFEASMYAADWTNRTVNHYWDYIDVDAFVDQHWIVEFTKQIDGYRINSYYHKDRGGKIAPGPIWDWSLGWGNADYLDGGHASGWYYPQLGQGDHVWLRRMINGTTAGNGTSGDADFNQKIADRWAVLRANIMNGPRLLNRIDELTYLLRNAATRNYTKYPILGRYDWPNPNGNAGGLNWDIDYVSPTTHPAIMAQMKQWTERRFEWVDAQFLRAPELSSTGGIISPGHVVTINSPEGATVYYRTDGRDPRMSGGGIRPGSQIYSGPITLNGNSRVVARANAPGYWQNTWSSPAAATFVLSTPALIISELMYHPLDPSLDDTNDASNYEYIELKNMSGATLDLTGFKFVNGIEFDFSLGSVPSLAPGASVLVVKNIGSFTARYGAAANIAGEFMGSLANEGERIVLWGPMQEIVHDFTFDDDWHLATDGLGLSLVVADEEQDRSAWGTREGWRASGTIGGSPGQDNGADPGIPPILVNEVLTHTDLPDLDSIELYNPTDQDVNIGGWFLSDDRGTPKFEIPSGTIIAAKDYRVFTENDFNAEAAHTERNFTLRSAGDEVYVFSGTGSGVDDIPDLTGYMHGFEFGASLNGVSFGRYINSQGDEHFVSQSAITLDAVNAGPKVGPVVISEFMYRPPDVFVNSALWDNTEHQFVELHNISGGEVPLFDPLAPTNSWVLRDAVNYTFPSNTTMQAGERILVTNFDPVHNSAALADFLARYELSLPGRIFGPFQGRLSNVDEHLELVQPDVVTTTYTNRIVTSVIVDKVDYRRDTPWPVAADGIGSSLQRIDANAYGNDPANWVAAAPSPGAGYTPGPAPVIDSQPADVTVVAYQNASFSITTSGGGGDLSYQWQHNGQNILNANGPTLHLMNVQPNQAGSYRAVVFSAANSTVSQQATLAVLIPVTILRQPQDAELVPGGSTNFTVGASSNTSITYQWRKNGVAIPGANRPSLNIVNAQPSDDAFYDVVLTDANGPIVSSSARLLVLVPPSVVLAPVSQTAVVGGSVTFSIETDGALPMGYRWRRGNFTIHSKVLDSHLAFFTLNNVQTSDAGNYSVILTNKAFFMPGLPVFGFSLTIQTDTDGDGLSDLYEAANGLDANRSDDAGLDSDEDGMTNREEQIAGTNPQDDTSYLKVEPLTADGSASITFQAAAGKTYTVAYKDGIQDALWKKLTDIVARTAAGPVTVQDALGEPFRIYRLVTPRQPME